MPARRITPPERSELERWVRLGLDIAAAHHQVSRSTIVRWCRVFDIHTNPTGRKPGPQPERRK